jgi:hypothetical protein
MSRKLTLNEKRSFVSNLWENKIQNVPQLHEITHIPRYILMFKNLKVFAYLNVALL